MSSNENQTLAGAVEAAIDVEIFMDNIKSKYGVAKPITRQLIAEFGISLPKIYDALRELGYAVPVKEK